MTPPGRRFSLTPQQRLDWLRLIRSEGVGPKTFRSLLNRFGSAAAAIEALPDLARGSGRTVVLASERDVTAEFALAERLGATFVARGEPHYPAALDMIDDAPPLIAVRGQGAALQRPGVAIVGARNASAAGRRFTALLAHGLGEAGFVVVSGLARGIDGAAHEAALAGGTVAVLAGGLGRIYPPEHRELAERIAATGCLLSEMPLSWTATARDFPRRNRLVSGMSYGVVVVEAALRSGSLITARLAGEQGREVFAVPGSPLDPRAEGTNRLIRQGATLVTSAADVVEALEPMVRTGRLPPPPLREQPGGDGIEWDDADDPDDDGEAGSPAVDDGARHRRLLSLLGPSPVSVDDIVRASGLPAREVHVVLLELDLAGRIERHGENRVSLLG